MTFINGLNISNNQSLSASALKSNELDQILIYDLGFCYLMMLNFEYALQCFGR